MKNTLFPKQYGKGKEFRIRYGIASRALNLEEEESFAVFFSRKKFSFEFDHPIIT